MSERMALATLSRLALGRIRPSSSTSSYHISARRGNENKPATETKANPVTEAKKEEVAERPLYMTKQRYDQTSSDHRYRSADAETGHKPTAFQRRFLVVTRLYPNGASIPELVPRGTMNRYHDRMRVVFIVAASAFFFVIFYTVEAINARRIDRDRRSGKIVTSM